MATVWCGLLSHRLAQNERSFNFLQVHNLRQPKTTFHSAPIVRTGEPANPTQVESFVQTFIVLLTLLFAVGCVAKPGDTPTSASAVLGEPVPVAVSGVAPQEDLPDLADTIPPRVDATASTTRQLVARYAPHARPTVRPGPPVRAPPLLPLPS
jgi:hypothetical protein